MYNNAQDQLFEYANVEIDRLKQVEHQAKKAALQSKYGIATDNEPLRPVEHYRSLESIQERLQELTTSFRDDVTELTRLLANHSDVNLRFLSFRLNFNEFYQNQPQPPNLSPIRENNTSNFNNHNLVPSPSPFLSSGTTSGNSKTPGISGNTRNADSTTHVFSPSPLSQSTTVIPPRNESSSTSSGFKPPLPR